MTLLANLLPSLETVCTDHELAKQLYKLYNLNVFSNGQADVIFSSPVKTANPGV